MSSCDIAVLRFRVCIYHVMPIMTMTYSAEMWNLSSHSYESIILTEHLYIRTTDSQT